MNQTNQLIKYIISLLSLLLITTNINASTYLPIEDDLVYVYLSRLEAEGVIESGLLNTRPISRKEAARLVREAEEKTLTASEFIKQLIRSLKERVNYVPTTGTQIKTVERVYVSSTYTNAERRALQIEGSLQYEQPLNYNNNGDLYKRGLNMRTGFTSRIEDWGPVSFEINPEFRYPEEPFTQDRFVTKKAYAVFDLGWDVTIGQDSQWWGPGYHGALLLTNHAEPLTILRLANPSPVRLPWIFDYLGPFGTSFFVTNLEKARDIPKPYLYGLRFDFKPHPSIEIGLEKTALLGGGKGRKEDVGTWVDSLLPFDDKENEADDQVGDQRAGFDLKITIPWNVQPMQLYIEAAGEDEVENLPTEWAAIVGLYLPRILGAERFDLRVEYANINGSQFNPYIWYVHHIYTSGYTYKGNIIGHHVGTDATDLFLELSYLMPHKNGKVFLSYDKEEHDMDVKGAHQTLQDATIGMTLSLTKQIDVSARYSHGWLRNLGNVPRETMDLTAFGMEIGYRF